MTRGTTYLDDLRNDKTYSPPENPERHDRVITLKILNPPYTSSAHPAEVEIRVKQNPPYFHFWKIINIRRGI